MRRIFFLYLLGACLLGKPVWAASTESKAETKVAGLDEDEVKSPEVQKPTKFDSLDASDREFLEELKDQEAKLVKLGGAMTLIVDGEEFCVNRMKLSLACPEFLEEFRIQLKAKSTCTKKYEGHRADVMVKVLRLLYRGDSKDNFVPFKPEFQSFGLLTKSLLQTLKLLRLQHLRPTILRFDLKQDADFGGAMRLLDEREALEAPEAIALAKQCGESCLATGMGAFLARLPAGYLDRIPGLALFRHVNQIRVGAIVEIRDLNRIKFPGCILSLRGEKKARIHYLGYEPANDTERDLSDVTRYASGDAAIAALMDSAMPNHREVQEAIQTIRRWMEKGSPIEEYPL